MAFCTKCGAQIDDNIAYCTVCGNPTGASQPQYQQPTYQQPTYQQPTYQQPQYQQPYNAYGTNPLDTGSIGWAFLGFFIPIAGLILYLTWKNERPLNAKQAGKGALISVIVNVVFTIIYFIIFVGLMGAGIASSYFINLLF